MRKLWNRPVAAVWSLVTKDEKWGANLNICTYVTSVSLKPKLILIVVYRGTRTLENLRRERTTLLQLLPVELAPVVRVAGQQSGRTVDKWARLKRRFTVGELGGLPYLADALGVIQLQIIEEYEASGDHLLVVARVIKNKNLHTGEILTTEYLRQNAYIR